MTNFFRRFSLPAGLAAVVISSLIQPLVSQAAESIMPGTTRLMITQPIDEVMVAGIDRFALRELAASPARRDQDARRDFSTAEAYAKSMAGPREKFREYIGAVDPRVKAVDFEPLDLIGRNATIGDSDLFTVLAVRWPVLDGVTGEGLLLQPKGAVKARAVVLPDADWTPEMFVGLASGVAPQAQLPRRMAARGWQVLVPMLISRRDELSGSPTVRFTNQPHREWIYRQAFEMGRHVIGYEVQKVLAAIDIFTAINGREKTNLPLGVAGVGEGGLLALYSSALDERIARTLVCGYFEPREGIWQEPIYRNVWGLLTQFGDAELAGLVAPRALTIEACAAPEVAGPPTPQPMPRPGRTGAAPGRIETPKLPAVRQEFARAKATFDQLKAGDRLKLIVSENGRGPAGSEGAMAAMLDQKDGAAADAAAMRAVAIPAGYDAPNEPLARERRQFFELQDHVQMLARLSAKVRDAKWAKADDSSVEKWNATVEPFRDWVYDEVYGRLPKPTVPLNVQTRLVTSAYWIKGHEEVVDAYEVVLDVFPDVVAGGILLLPKNLKPDGVKRPVIVMQHGLEGVPEDMIVGPGNRLYPYNKAFSVELCRRGFVIYAPQNPFRGKDAFRTLQRKSNVLKRSLFSYIIPQHDRTLEWLGSLPYVDATRIAFYGISYGGKTAMRVPPMVKRYALSICSADYNEWIKKTTGIEYSGNYLFTGEYEMFEWNMGHVANYAELSKLMTPRPFMVERGHGDTTAPDEWPAWEYAKVRRHYDKIGLGDKTEMEVFIGGHELHGVGTFEFLHKHLNWPKPAR